MQINHSLESLLSKRESTIVTPKKLWREIAAFIIEDHVFEKERCCKVRNIRLSYMTKKTLVRWYTRKL